MSRNAIIPMEKRDARKLKISAQHEYLNNDFKRNMNAKYIPVNKKELAKKYRGFYDFVKQLSSKNC